MSGARPRYGSHLSVAGGLHHAIDEAVRLGLGSVQVFTKNQRQWRVPPLPESEIALWRASLKRAGWQRECGERVVSHGSYLVNLASPDSALRKKSIALHVAELERCEALGIERCVIHPGAHMGASRKPSDPNPLREPATPDERAGLERIAASLDAAHRATPGLRVRTCLETTTGAGTALGYDFAHLAAIIGMVKEPKRLAACIDTCHIVSAGYDMSTVAAARRTLDEFRDVVGEERLLVAHINDSQAPPGSRRDRHAHIGHGTCGDACFRAILARRAWRTVPMILETPKEGSRNGTPWDLANIAALEAIRTAAAGPSRTAKAAARGAAGRAARTAARLLLVALLVAGTLGTAACRDWTRPVRKDGRDAATSTSGGGRTPTEAERIRLEEADGLQERGAYEEALLVFREVLQQNPLLPEAYIGVGDVRYKQGRYSDAEPAYARAADLDPRSFRAHHGRGKSLQMQGRTVDAIRAYQRALSVDPDSADANLNMATAYLSLGEARIATGFAERAVSLDPRNGAARVNLGVAYERTGRASEAVGQYRQAVELMPPTPQVWINLVNALVADGRYAEAMQACEELVRVDAGADSWERVGWARFRAGEYESSSDAYRAAVAADRRHWPSWNGIGVNALNRWLLSERREVAAANEARQAFRTSMEINPDQPRILRLMATYGL
jgi:deoxyribonuclease-4